MIQWKRIGQFVGLTFLVNWSLAGLMALLGWYKNHYLMTGVVSIYMLVPMSVAIFLIKGVYKEKLANYGVRWKFNGWWLLAWLMPLLIVLLSLGVTLVLRFGRLDLSFSAFLATIKNQLGEAAYQKAAGQLKNIAPFLIIAQILVGGTTINALFAFGEELGWRGFLQKELAAWGFWKSSALIGAVWGFWHAPLILMGLNFPDQRLAGVVVMIAACIPLGILISYVRKQTGSVFSAAVFHGMFNATFGLPIMIISGGSRLFILPLGVSGIIAMALLTGLLALLMGKNKAISVAGLHG